MGGMIQAGPHSHESVIFLNFWDSYLSNYGEFNASLSLQAYSLDGTTSLQAGRKAPTTCARSTS